jgi:hypothetical protein
MKFQEVVVCLDCDFTGRPARVDGRDQCPQCASRALWFVSAFCAPEWLRAKLAGAGHGRPARGCCELVPSFFGGRGV